MNDHKYRIMLSHNLSICAICTTSSAMSKKPCELADFKGVGHFEVKF